MAKKTTGICMGYKYRIYPNKEQQRFINQNIGAARVLWNAMLTELRDHNKQWRKKKAAGEDVSKMRFDFNYTRFKQKYEWMELCDSNALNYAGRHLKEACMDKSKGKPQYKKHGVAAGSYSTDGRAVKLSEDGRWLSLPKMGKMTGKASMRIITHRPLAEGKRLQEVTVSRTANFEYYASFKVELPEGQQPEFTPVANKETGIDLGLTDFLILSDGTKVDNPRFLQKSLAKLRREQRKLSRMGRIAKEEGRNLREAKNYQKQRIKVATLNLKVARQREYFLHNLSTQMVREHKFIAMETLDIKGMMQQRKMARAIADVSWFEFGRQLSYKAEWAGRTVVKINQWFPSTQKCHCCGHVIGPIPTVVRQWQCPECGEVHDRDVNAAINIYQEGKRLQETPV
ncbi:RNA-guided endonuclease TnpB family protein [Enterococcus asini]|uniref:RNA-guided endonuclease InsQ/TnpB family protein n=1 Tax=Enterococcus asini TaxID=57732 RepID=UPI00288D3B36|nr:RNA-guided endonuclease TnpB family protein [Enterococcus asini]MDT2783127.1 RNA-guided endonuclease TnpB family protein [Enterococcus asini]